MITPEEFAYLMISTAQFVPHGRSYEEVDCWGVVQLGYRDVLGIDIPSYATDYSDKDTLGTSHLSDLITEHRKRWHQVYNPKTMDKSELRAKVRQMDVALFLIDERPVHVGLMIEMRLPRVLHAEKYHGVFTERLDIPLWANRLEGIYRYER